jgi:hypothetical protein
LRPGGRGTADWGFIGRAEAVFTTWIDVAYTWSRPGSRWVASSALPGGSEFFDGCHGRWYSGHCRSIRDGFAAGNSFPSCRPLSGALGVVRQPRSSMSALPDPAWANQLFYHHVRPTRLSVPQRPIEQSGAAPDWSFLDAAYCISLKTREDRAAQGQSSAAPACASA